ncbi:caspase family protein [Streptomyces sp. NPDC021020]|uniref:wHTH domain-containing protein n=1 Tax=Streptomyces sp. NPDC021020 TaxID=3365109 RepID=UPI0037B2BD34
MGALRALLIAVPGDLGFTAADTARVKDALLASGYAEADVTVLDTPEQTGRARLYAALRTFLGGLRDEDAALVYYSGHGVRVDDVDHLVPYGYDPAAGPAELVAVRPDELLGGLTAQATLLVCLDACRDALTSDPGQVSRPEFTRLRENVVLLYGCPAGRQAMGTPDGSFMGRALAEALSPDTPPRTVGEVITAVRQRTREIAADNGQSARLDTWWLHGRTGAPAAAHAERVVCASGPGTGPWAEAVRNSTLWDRVAPGATGTGPLADGLGRLVEKVAAIRRDAAHPHKAGPDPWDDPDHPVRVLRRLDHLVPPAARGGSLSALEAVALLATPFVREAAVACGRRALARLHPPQGPRGATELDEDGSSASDPGSGSGSGDEARRHLADDMADVRRAFGQIEAKRQRLLAAAEAAETAGNQAAAAEARDAAVAAESWLRHRLLAGWDQLWDQLAEQLRAPGSGRPALAELDSLTAVMELLTETAAKAAGLGAHPPAHSRDRLRAALFQVVAQMRTRPGPDAPNDELWQTGLAAQLGIWTQPAFWRPARLAELLYVAELLAVDPRLLDGIVVDHLGVPHHRVTAADVVAQVVACDVRPVDAEHSADWALFAACRSAALHVALERQADSASSAARNIAKAQPNEILLSALPRHLNTDALAPSGDGAGTYEAPPPRFQLAEDGVKPLIMGTQLYGDRMLAVRELYQNALDACRRRQARQQYAARTGDGTRQPAELASYTVAFTLARDPADGRLYVECHDDGIGMTAEELRDLFARAGRRNEQSPARVRELRRWRRVGIVPELNSRFGIGVFSYFMLAEEIRVTTRPAARSGFGAGPRGHRVDVVADSGLMHITPCDDIDAGTTVRLYLRPEFESEPPPSLIRFLRDQVWCSPVTLTVEQQAGDEQASVRQTAGELANVSVGLLPRQDGRRGVWWVDGAGKRLVDGIVVAEDPAPYGYVIDLRHRHKPVLSANRNALTSFDRETVRRELADAAADLAQWETPPLSWLWALVNDDPALGMVAVERLLTADAAVEVRGVDPRRSGRLMPLRTVGCLPVDSEEARRRLASSSDAEIVLFTQWRSDLSRSWPAAGGGGRRWFPKGFPRPRAVDAVVFRNPDIAETIKNLPPVVRSVSGAMDPEHWSPGLAALRAAANPGLPLRTTVRALRRYAVTGIDVPPAGDIRALDKAPSTPEAVDLYRLLHRSEHGTMQPEGAPDPDPGPLVESASRWGRTLGHTAELAGRLRLLDPRIPEPPDLGELAEHVPTLSELIVLKGSHVPSMSLPALVTPPIAAYFAALLGCTAADVAETARRYRPFGYRVAEGDYLRDHLHLEDFDVVSARYHSVLLRMLTGPVTLHRLMALAAEQTAVDVGTTLARLRVLADKVGLPLHLDDTRLSPLLTLRPAGWFKGLFPVGDEPVRPCGAGTILRALARADRQDSVDEEVARVAALVTAGLAEPGAVPVVRRWLDLPAQKRPTLLFRTNWFLSDQVGGIKTFDTSPGREPDPVHLFCAAAQSQVDLGTAADLMRAEAEPFSLGIPDVPPECRALRPDYNILEVLCTRDGNAWRPAVSLRALLGYAKASRVDLPTAAARLRAYEPLGAPAISGPAVGSVPVWPEGDPEVERLLRYPPLRVGVLTPLTLVITAVRLDLGLRATYRALAPYGPYGLDMSNCPEPADDAYAADWRDVILLTRKLTGAEPALGGEVTVDHIELAAEETELTPAEVRERLAYFAPLFGLTLPAEAAETAEAADSAPAPEVTAHAGP